MNTDASLILQLDACIAALRKITVAGDRDEAVAIAEEALASFEDEEADESDRARTATVRLFAALSRVSANVDVLRTLLVAEQEKHQAEVLRLRRQLAEAEARK